jgi:hypothetical protein
LPLSTRQSPGTEDAKVLAMTLDTGE